jgi:hypothetical protein
LLAEDQDIVARVRPETSLRPDGHRTAKIDVFHGNRESV